MAEVGRHHTKNEHVALLSVSNLVHVGIHMTEARHETTSTLFQATMLVVALVTVVLATEVDHHLSWVHAGPVPTYMRHHTRPGSEQKRCC